MLAGSVASEDHQSYVHRFSSFASTALNNLACDAVGRSRTRRIALPTAL
jgi:hypothetical protein